MSERPLIAVLGCPNTGKSTVFNRLTGLRQKTANYPGVTVERIAGRVRLDSGEAELVDLPGAYSLAADGPESSVTLDVMLGAAKDQKPPDALLLVADASNLRRSLFLFSQASELGIPIAVALNMEDVAESQGIEVDSARLADELGVSVTPMAANRGKGIRRLRAALSQLLSAKAPAIEPLMPEVRREAMQLREEFRPDGLAVAALERAVIDREGEFERRFRGTAGTGCGRSAGRKPGLRAARAEGVKSLQACEAARRYRQVDRCLEAAVESQARAPAGVRALLESAVTHPVLGVLVFLVVMSAVFQAIFAWAAPLMDGIDALFEHAGAWALERLPPGALSSLLIDGLWSGIGAVVIFLPQIVFLFALVLFLEDCGYMARASFLMDRLLRGCGLSGQSFIPLLSGFACAIPAIMAARVVDDRRTKLATIAAIPLMTCSARLPRLCAADLRIRSSRANTPTAGSIGTGWCCWACIYWASSAAQSAH